MQRIKEANDYEVIVKTTTLGESEKKKTPFVDFLFATESGETINGQLYLSDAALERTVQTLREVFGFDDNFETIAEQTEGKPANITVVLEEYTNDKGETKEYAKVAWINKPGGIARKIAPIANAAKAISRFSLLAKKVPAKDGTAPKKPTAPAPKPNRHEADDTPF